MKSQALEPLVYSRKQVMQLLSCSESLIRNMEARGQLNPIFLGSGSRGMRYRRAEVESLLLAPKVAKA